MHSWGAKTIFTAGPCNRAARQTQLLGRMAAQTVAVQLWWLYRSDLSHLDTGEFAFSPPPDAPLPALASTIARPSGPCPSIDLLLPFPAETFQLVDPIMIVAAAVNHPFVVCSAQGRPCRVLRPFFSCLLLLR